MMGVNLLMRLRLKVISTTKFYLFFLLGQVENGVCERGKTF